MGKRTRQNGMSSSFFAIITGPIMKTYKEMIEMMAFIILTLSFTVAILLSGVVGFLLITQPNVMKWYMNYMLKIMNNMEEAADDVMAKDL